MHLNLSTGYYSAPYSLSPLPESVHTGLGIIAGLATLSTLTTSGLLAFITYRFITWREQHTEWVGRNPSVVLVYNLLLADLFQASSYLINYHWYHVDGIFAPSGWCHVQGAFLNFGDVASAGFVMAIALHTLYSVVRGRRLAYAWLCSVILAIWILACLLTIIGPLMHGEQFFTNAGNWCWISPQFESERLFLHYLWVFLVEFGTIIIYCGLFIYLHRRMTFFRVTGSRSPASTQMTRATQYMLLYPVVYIILTLPLATARMMTLSGRSPENITFLASGGLLASCGWLDAIVYTFTRRVLIDTDIKRTRLASSGSSYKSEGTRRSMRCKRPENQCGNFTKITGGLNKSDSDENLPRISPQGLRSNDIISFEADDMGQIMGKGPGRFQWNHTVSIQEERTDGAPLTSRDGSLDKYHKWND